MKKLLVVILLFCGITAKAGYDLHFINNDGKDWYYLSHASWLTNYYDYYLMKGIPSKEYCGDYRVVDGLVKMVDESATDTYHKKALEDYKSLQSLLLMIYPDCEATVWEDKNVNADLVIITFKCDKIKGIEGVTI